MGRNKLKLHKEDELLTVTQVAHRIGVTARTVRNWDEEGYLKPDRRGKNGYRWYKSSSIETFIGTLEKDAKA